MEIGGIMGEKWNLPESIVEAIRCHSDIGKAEIDKKFTCIIYLYDEHCTKTEGIYDFRLVI